MEVKTNYISSMMNNNSIASKKQTNVPGSEAKSWHDQLLAEVNKGANQSAAEMEADGMREYEQELSERILAIPVGSGLAHTSVTIRISDKALERMKVDPGYEKLVMAQLGQALGGNAAVGGGNQQLIIHIGEKIEDYKIESRPTENVSPSSEEKVDYWQMRTERFEKIEEQMDKLHKKKRRIDKQLHHQDMAAQIQVEIVRQQAIQNGEPGGTVQPRKAVYLAGVPAEMLLSIIE